MRTFQLMCLCVALLTVGLFLQLVSKRKEACIKIVHRLWWCRGIGYAGLGLFLLIMKHSGPQILKLFVEVLQSCLLYLFFFSCTNAIYFASDKIIHLDKRHFTTTSLECISTYKFSWPVMHGTVILKKLAQVWYCVLPSQHASSKTAKGILFEPLHILGLVPCLSFL